MMRARDIMSTEVVAVGPDTPYPDIVSALVDHDISGVPVLDDGRLVGIVTESDLVAKEAHGGERRRLLDVVHDMVHPDRPSPVERSRGRTAGTIMTPDPITAHPDDSLREVARRLVDRNVKRLPVVDDDGAVVGMVSRHDVLVALHRPDDDIRLEVERMLQNPVHVPEDCHVDVEVRDGVVRLSGTTRFPLDIPVLVSLVWKVAGVVDVEGDVRATQPDPSPIIY